MANSDPIRLIFISTKPKENDLKVIQQLPDTFPQITFLNIAETSEEAIELCKKTPPNIVILDSWIREMDTIETAKILRDKNSDAIIFILSAGLSTDLIRMAMNAKANDVISKPLRLDIVIDYIQITLSKME